MFEFCVHFIEVRVPLPVWFHLEAESCSAMKTSVLSRTIGIVPPEVHSWSELKYQCSSSRASAKKWLTTSAPSCSLEAHWLKRNIGETMPKCHWPELAWAVLPLFLSFPALASPHPLDHSSIPAFCKWSNSFSYCFERLLLSSTAYILWYVYLVSSFSKFQWHIVIRLYGKSLGIKLTKLTLSSWFFWQSYNEKSKFPFPNLEKRMIK